jgi:phosphatidylglycerophosphatase A
MKSQKLKLSNPIHLLASTFGVGLIPFAPGTWGTVAAIPFYLLLCKLPLYYYCGVVALLFGIGVWLSAITMRDLGVYDHPQIVIDETVGFFITMIAAPHSWIWIVIGFVLFRFFDILKPWPINVADEKIQNGFGIMFDDLLAAIFSLLVIQVLRFTFPSL